MNTSMIPPRARASLMGGAALLALGFAAVPAQADVEEDARIMFEVVEAAGCFINDDNQRQILQETGMDPDRGFAALQILVGRQQMRLTDEYAVLTAGACAEHAGEAVPPEELAARRAAVSAAMAAAGCRVTQRNIDEVLAGTGLDDELQIATLMMLTASGEARYERVDGTEQFVLLTGPCAEGAGADDAPVDPSLPAGARVALLVGAVREAGCTMTEAVGMERLPALGLQQSEVRDIAEALVDAGLADIVDGSLVLDDALCAADPAADARVLAGRAVQPPSGPAEALPATPGASNETPREALMRAMAAVGCVGTEDNTEEVLRLSGLTIEDASDVYAEMIEAGELEMLEGGASARLIAGPCADGAAATPQTTAPAPTGADLDLALDVVRAIRANGCAALEAEMDGLMAPIGPRDDVRSALRALIDGGQVMTPPVAGRTVLLGEALCDATEAALDGAVRQAVAGGPASGAIGSRLGGARLFMAELRDRQCVYSQSRALAAFEEMDLGAPQTVLERLSAVGLIRQEGDFLSASDLGCTGEFRLVDAFLSAAFQEPKRKP